MKRIFKQLYFAIFVTIILSLLCTNVSAASSSYIPGDVNGDSVVNIDDAIYLLKHTMLPSRYPLSQSGDVNGTDEVNIDDAIYLLKHTMLPSRYPIANTNTIIYHNVDGLENSNPKTYSESENTELTGVSQAGYHFVGWYSDANFTNKVSEIAAGTTGRIELYAKWEAIEYTATFKDGDTIVDEIKFTVETDSITPPAVPNHAGYTGVWESYTLGTEDIVINAVYEAIPYNITYHNVAGATHTNPTRYNVGTQPIALNDARKIGYTFMGWYAESTFQNKVTIISVGTTGNLNLYAKWEAIKYTATFKDGNTIVDEIKFTVETESITPPAVPNHAGYTGVWESYTLGTEDITVNAIYTVMQFTITWRNNDGELLKTTLCDYGKIPTFGSEIPARESDAQYNYVFAGWAPEIKTAYDDAEYIAVYNKTVRTSYTITYDANGGTNAPSSQSKTSGSSTTLSTSVPTREGKKFVGWICANDGKTYKAGASFNIDADVTLYAVWGHNCSTCTGTGATSTSYSCSNCGGDGKVSSSSGDYRDCSACSNGYISNTGVCSSCGGWGGRVLCECSCGNRWWADQTGSRRCSRCSRTVAGTRYTTCSGCGGTGIGKTSTKCSACQGYGEIYVPTTTTSSCSSCGGSGTKTSTSTCATCDGDKVLADACATHTVTLKNGTTTVGTASVVEDRPYKLTVPTKTGYTFIGWFDSAENGTQYTDGKGVSLSIWAESSNKTLYAHWSLNYYTITYDCDSNVNLSNMPSVYTVEDADVLLNIQQRDYYTFKWVLDQATVASVDTALAKDVVVKGIWTPIEYTIVYALDGGESDNVTHYNVESNTFSLRIPTKMGYTFVGWTGSNGQEPTMTVTIPKGSHGNLTYTANWVIGQYVITFDANGGYTEQSNVSATYLESMPLITEVPTRDGYIFMGYYDAATGGVKYYNADLSSARKWDKGSNATFYAHWQGVPYYVVFDANNGTGTMGRQEFEYGLSEQLKSNQFTRTGCAFAGWNTKADGSGTAYADNASVLNLTATNGEEVTLYAQWTAKVVTGTLADLSSSHTSCTVNFNLNGASGNAPSAQTVTNSVGLTYPAVPTRSGYAFAGWYTNSNCTGTPYDFAAGVTEDITLYAKWVAMSTTSHTREYFNVMNYTSSSSQKSVTASSYSDYNYYYFTCYTSGTYKIYETWVQGDFYFEVLNVTTGQSINKCNLYSSKTSNTVTFTASAGDVICIRTIRYSSSYNMTSNGKFYVSGAKYPTAGGKADGIVMVTEQLTYGQEFTLDVPTREGYTFEGWYDGEGGTGTQYTDATGASLRAWDKEVDTTLYAKWTVVESTVTFNKQNGTGGSDSVTVTYDSTMPQATAPTRVGYTFAGYYTAINGGTKYYNADMTSATTCKLAEDTTLYARWSANTYTITLDNQGGAGASRATAAYGSVLPAIAIPTKEGYTFAGYYDAAVDGTKYYDANMSSTVVWSKLEGIKLYAHWEANNYTISFNANGGTVSESSMTVTYNASYTLPTPTRDEYTFVGWYNGETKYSGGTWSIASNVSLTAKWTSNFTYTTSGASLTITGYIGSDSEVNIPTSIDGKTVTTIAANAFANKTFIQSIVVPNSVTSIGEGAFKGCNSLVSITLPFVGSSSSVSSYAPNDSYSADSQLFGYIFGSTTESYTSNGTNLVYQGQAYYSSSYPYRKYYIPSSLRTVTITNATGISAYAFYGCNKLTSVTLNSGVTTIYSYAFYGCSSLTSFTVPTSTTTIGSYAFHGNTSLSTLTFNSKVTSIGSYAFYNCSKVTSVALPSTLKTIGDYAFYNNQLSSLTIPTSVTSIGSYAFANNTAITSLTVPGNVATIGSYAFSGCSNIATLTLNSGIQSIGDYAFENLKVTTVTVPNSVTSIGEGAFKGCNSLVSITLPFVGSSSSVSSYAPNDSYSADSQLFGYIFGSTTESYTSNGTNLVYQGQAYYSSSYPYRKYYIPSSLRTVTITNATGISAYAFYNCKNLTSITLNSAAQNKVYSNAFYNCTATVKYN